MNLSNLITSQSYINDEIVAAKRAAGDYSILVSPEFDYEGETYRVLLDGHHSLAAALEDGAEIDVTEATATMSDSVALIEKGQIEDFLSATYMDSDYRFALSGKDVW